MPPGDLVRAASEGDRAAWDALVERYTPMLWGIARGHRLDAHAAGDVVQTSWLRLVEHLDRLQEPDHVGAWLATTARRETLRVLRLAARQTPTEPDELPEPLPGPGPDARTLVAERDRALAGAFSRLSERCRLLLRLLLAEPTVPYAEIGAALDMPVGSIGPTRARCLAQLRQEAQVAGITDAASGSL